MCRPTSRPCVAGDGPEFVNLHKGSRERKPEYVAAEGGGDFSVDGGIRMSDAHAVAAPSVGGGLHLVDAEDPAWVVAPRSIPRPAPAGTQLFLIGGFELRHDGEPVPLSTSAKRMLAFLALQDRPLARGYVAGTLWSETTDTRAAASVRTALWRLKQPGLDVIDADNGTLALSRRVFVDLHDVRVTARRLMDTPASVAVEPLDLALLSGDLLPDWYDDWVILERERLRQVRLHALEALCAELTDAGRHADAIEVGLCAVACEPLRETSNLLLVKAYLAEGNRLEAIRLYRDFRDLLHEELGLHPAAAMEDLVGPMLTP